MATETSDHYVNEFQRASREMVLCLAGLFAVHKVDDAVVWEAAQAFHQIIERARTRFRTPNGDRSGTGSVRQFRPHPAMEELLSRLDSTAAPEVAP